MTATVAKRFISLDVLRGLTVIGMIMVNVQGEGPKYKFLAHSSWNGCTVADLVFPFFLFIVGASICFVAKKHNYELNKKLTFKILKRGALIFLTGFLLNIFPFNGDPSSWRILGVLQRIAIVYVATFFLVLWLKSPKRIVLITVCILLCYRILMLIFGCTLENNIVLVVDRFLFGEKHLYTGYGIPFDPEGMMSSLPAICNALIGYMTSLFLLKDHQKYRVPYRTGLLGVVLILSGLLWNLVFPINKPVWSSSFVLYTCGWAILLWAIIFWVIDVNERKRWTPFFLVFGTNALFTYILSELIIIFNRMFSFTANGQIYHVSTWLDAFLFAPLTTTPLRAALWGITVVVICWAATFPLYRKKIYLKL